MELGQRITVVIPARNEGDEILDALQSLREQTTKPDEIIVVDDNSQDDTAQIASAAGVSVVRSEGKSAAGARNTGIRYASADVIAFIDADEVASPTWVESIMSCLQQCQAGVCTGPVLPYERSIWAWTYHLPFLLHMESGECKRAPYLLAGNLAVRRQVLDRVGLFDERIGSQDREFHSRLAVHGIPTVMNPKMRTRHKGHSSFREGIDSMWTLVALDLGGFRLHGLRFYSYIRFMHYFPYYVWFGLLAILPFLLRHLQFLAILVAVALAAGPLLLLVYLYRSIKVKLMHKTMAIVAFLVFDAIAACATAILAIAALLLALTKARDASSPSL